jgi:hypothetical protein
MDAMEEETKREEKRNKEKNASRCNPNHAQIALVMTKTIVIEEKVLAKEETRVLSISSSCPDKSKHEPNRDTSQNRERRWKKPDVVSS